MNREEKIKLMKISLVIPVKNEAESIENLCLSINRQTRRPDEIIIVDGGSTDETIRLAKKITAGQAEYKLIETPEASPGKGRNIGVENAENDWIAFTDAGIKLEKDWLKKLVQIAESSSKTDIVYGNFSPVTNSFFEKCAAISYVPPIKENQIRGKSIASCLLKKNVWETVGGFPDLRAAEDLMFMEAAEVKGFIFDFAPEAKIHWYLRPDLTSTFRKFVLYSKHNVWANRQWDWHYGVVKQYLIIISFIILAVVHSHWWLIGILLWLMARTVKRVLPHHYEFGLMPLLNPGYFFSIMFLILVIDLATFIGWGQAILSSKS